MKSGYMKPEILELALKNLKEVDDVTKQVLGKDGCPLLGLAIEAKKLSEPYEIEPGKGLLFDFRSGDEFCLWSIIDGKKILEFKEYYNSITTQVYVSCFFKAAERGWFGKTVRRGLLIDEIDVIWPFMAQRHITNRIKRNPGKKLFGYNDRTWTVEITYIPKEVEWKRY